MGAQAQFKSTDPRPVVGEDYPLPSATPPPRPANSLPLMPSRRTIAGGLLLASLALAVTISLSPRSVAHLRDACFDWWHQVTATRAGTIRHSSVYLTEITEPGSLSHPAAKSYKRLDLETADTLLSRPPKGPDAPRVIEMAYFRGPRLAPNPIVQSFAGSIQLPDASEMSFDEAQIRAMVHAAFASDMRLETVTVDVNTMTYTAGGLAHDTYQQTTVLGGFMLLLGIAGSIAFLMWGRTDPSQTEQSLNP